jgi:hypothetical protein
VHHEVADGVRQDVPPTMIMTPTPTMTVDIAVVIETPVIDRDAPAAWTPPRTIRRYSAVGLDARFRPAWSAGR